MKFFIDTANLAHIQEAKDLGILDGVTTNPSLMAKEGISGEQNIRNHYKYICELVDGDVSAEVIATDFEGMVTEGRSLAGIAPNIVVKVPMTRDGIKAISHFAERGIRTNCTLVFSRLSWPPKQGRPICPLSSAAWTISTGTGWDLFAKLQKSTPFRGMIRKSWQLPSAVLCIS